MKRFNLFAILVFLFIVGIIVYKISQPQQITHKTTKAIARNITEKIDIPGNVYPLKEIEIKSQLSGILDKRFVKIGDKVTLGTPIASIRLVPSLSDIERLESSVNSSQIEYDARKVEYDRAKRLFDTNTISSAEMELADKNLKQIKEQLSSATNQLDIIRNGKITSKDISNIVTSSTSGVVIDFPIEEGASITERNNYNPGTTLAIVAQMDKFKFQTLVAEHYLNNINIGDSILLSINALNNITIPAIISQISSKGKAVNGIIKYLLIAEFEVNHSIPTIRSGYSASASIVLEKINNTLSIEEKHIKYNKDSIFLKILDTTNNNIINKIVDIGISDGVYTEIISGIGRDEKVVID